MTKNPSNDQVGDTQSPALDPHGKVLRDAGDFSTHLAAEASAKSSKNVPIADLANASKSGRSNSVPNPTCTQTLWFSFFFDGTGSNLDADAGALKHSNVAKLFRVHAESDETIGIYRLYIPGVGTYFKAIGDPGGGSYRPGEGGRGFGPTEKLGVILAIAQGVPLIP